MTEGKNSKSFWHNDLGKIHWEVLRFWQTFCSFNETFFETIRPQLLYDVNNFTMIKNARYWMLSFTDWKVMCVTPSNIKNEWLFLELYWWKHKVCFPQIINSWFFEDKLTEGTNSKSFWQNDFGKIHWDVFRKHL